MAVAGTHILPVLASRLHTGALGRFLSQVSES